jgi:hypothetical protein
MSESLCKEATVVSFKSLSSYTVYVKSVRLADMMAGLLGEISTPEVLNKNQV